MEVQKKFWLICLPVIIWSCGTGKGMQSTPTTSYSAYTETVRTEELPVSTIHIPVALDLKEMFQMLEKENDPNFTSDQWPQYDEEECFRYKYRFIRSPFKIQARNNHVQITFSGLYQIAGSKALCAFGRRIGPWVNGSCGFDGESLRRVNLEIVSDISILPSHHIYSNTYLKKLEPLDPCAITVLQTDITQTIMDSIRASVNEYVHTMDSMVNALNKTPYFEQWRRKTLHALPVNEYGYLVLQPRMYNISPLTIQNDSLYFSIGFTGRNYFFSDTLHYPSEHSLPVLTNYHEQPGINGYLDIQYAYDSLEKILMDSIGKKPYQVDGNTFVIDQINVQSKSGNIDIQISFSGFKSGNIQITGTPVLDTSAQVLKLSSMKVNLQSKNILLKIAKKWIEKTIVKEVSGMAVIDMRALLNDELPALEKRMYQELLPGIQSTGNIESLKLVGMECRDKDIRLQVHMKGDFAIRGKLTQELLSVEP